MFVFCANKLPGTLKWIDCCCFALLHWHFEQRIGSVAEEEEEDGGEVIIIK